MEAMLALSPASSGGSYSAAPASPYDRAALRELLAARTFKRDYENGFLLASGARSRIFFDVKATMMHPRGAALCAHGLLGILAGLEADYVGGLEMGAVPLLSVIAGFSADGARPIPSFFVRKKAKERGTGMTIEGLDHHGGETLAGKRVVMIDDVATSGGSILQAVDQVEAAGGTMTDAIVVLDRQQGATEKLAARGITLHALFTAAELGVTAADREPLA
jgi:orotate phosphoribosyltransferase